MILRAAPLTRLLGLLLAGLTVLGVAPSVASAVAPPCRSTAALFPNPMPFARRDPTLATVELSAFQHGLWVGEAYDGNSVSVISWRPGHHHARRFGRFRYERWNGVGPDQSSSVDAVGVTPRGAIVAKVQTTSGAGTLQWPPVRALAWTQRGRRVRLRGFPHALTVEPLAVTDTGHVIGAARIGRPNRYHYVVAQWRTIFSRPTVLARLRHATNQPVADQRGDVAWSTSSGWSRARLADGEQIVLAPRFVQAALGAGEAVTDAEGEYLWRLPARAGSGPLPAERITRHRRYRYALALDAAGDVLYDGDHRDAVHYADGRWATLPREYEQIGWSGAFGEHRRVAYTGGRDHLAHMLTCRAG